MSPTQRAILTALYAAILGALDAALTDDTRRKLIDAGRSLAEDLGAPFPVPTRAERRVRERAA